MTVASEPITIVERRPHRALTIRRTLPQSELGSWFGEIFPKIRAAIVAQGGTLAGARFARYYNGDPSAFDTEAGIPFTGSVTASGEMRVTTLPGGRVAKTLHIGPYETLSKEYRRIEAWLAEHKERAGVGPWESYLDEPEAVTSATQRTEVYWPIAG